MASAVLPVTGRAGRIDRSSRPLERTTATLTMCEASMRAQKFLFGAVVTAAQQTGDCAQNGGDARTGRVQGRLHSVKRSAPSP